MLINASPASRSLDMVDLRYVFNLLSVLNERSHSADVIGNVHNVQIKVWMLGKNSRSHKPYSKMAAIFSILLFHCKLALLASLSNVEFKRIFNLERGQQGHL